MLVGQVERLESELRHLQSVSQERSVLLNQIEHLEDELRRLQSISQEKSVLLNQVEHLENELRRLQSISQERFVLFNQIERLENELNLQSREARRFLSDLATAGGLSGEHGEARAGQRDIAAERKKLEALIEERRPDPRKRVDFEFGTAEAFQ